MITLSSYNKRQCAEGQIFYNSKQECFETLPIAISDITLIVAYIQIGFDIDTMCVNQVSGFSPAYSWIKCKLNPPIDVIECELILNGDFDYSTYRLDRGNEWNYYYDAESFWFCVGNPKFDETRMNINFINNAVAVLNPHGELKALWVKIKKDV